MGWIINSASARKPRMHNSRPPSGSTFTKTAAAELLYRMMPFFFFPVVIIILALHGQRAEICVHTVFDGKTLQWHSNIKIHPQAHHCLSVLVCVYFQGPRLYLLKNTRGQGYSWSVIDSCWHCTDRSVWLFENRPPCPPHKSHFHVSLNLLKLRVLGEWANEASASAQEKYVIGDCYGIYFGPLWSNYLNPAMFVCTNTNCISVRPQPNLASVCCCSRGSIWAERQDWVKDQNS